jgi:sigma-B regulation protein RsbU (phosphoserine phosphatase)
MALAVYDPSDRSLVIARDGHNPVLLGGEQGVTEVPSRGAALGVRTGLQFPEDSMVLDPGATVALYTDGLTEARDPSGTLYGLERLEESLERCQNAPVRDTLEGVWDDVTAFRGDHSPTDDATLLLVRLT